jgi:hypothetical protein
MAQLRKLTGVSRFKLVKYHTSYSLMDLLSSRVRPPAMVNLPVRWQSQSPQFLYLWQPEL